MIDKIAELLSDVLGSYRPTAKNNLIFYCPFCKHTKKKLEVHPDKGTWRCWVCPVKGKSIYSLFKKLKVSSNYIDILNGYSGTNKYSSSFQENTETNQIINLPSGSIPIWEYANNFTYNRCVSYMKSRGLTLGDALKYQLHYCVGGKYSEMMIFPNYTDSGNINFYSSRSFNNRSKSKFVNAQISRDVVGFELQLSPDLPLILVESAIDAITVKRNASPLYGKLISKSMKCWILENNVTDLYICLDPDALSESLDIVEYFMNVGINVKLVDIPIGEDVNTLGHDKIWELINAAPLMNEFELFERKMSISI